MTLSLTLLTVFIILAYVFWPVLYHYNSEKGLIRIKNRGGEQELQAAMNTVLSDLKDIEFDYEIGKLTLEDFTELKTRYRRKAVELIKEIESLRAGKNLSKREAISKDVLTQGSSHSGCPQCGETCKPRDRFCGQCGYQLTV
jgi:hydrogenase maturation factor